LIVRFVEIAIYPSDGIDACHAWKLIPPCGIGSEPAAGIS